MKPPFPPSADLVARLHLLLAHSQRTYALYIDQGKTYFYARMLKRNNDRILELLLDRAHYLPHDLQPHALDLIEHLDAWRIQWEDLDQRQTHTLDEPFVFESRVRFPHAAVTTLMCERHPLPHVCSESTP